MKKTKHSKTTQRGSGRKTSPRPGLTAPTASPVPPAGVEIGISGATKLARRFGRRPVVTPETPGAEVEKSNG